MLAGSAELSVALTSAVLLLALEELWDAGLRMNDVASDELLLVMILLLVALAAALAVSVTSLSSNS